MTRLARMTRKLLHVRVSIIACVLVFWVLQLLAWAAMMAYVEFFPNHLKNSILYTIQISHWALVITCGTAATATWGLLQSHHNTRKLAEIQGDADAADATPFSE